MKIVNPLIELLAIKLFEHMWTPTYSVTSWLRADKETRETYRRMARGETDLPEAK